MVTMCPSTVISFSHPVAGCCFSKVLWRHHSLGARSARRRRWARRLSRRSRAGHSPHRFQDGDAGADCPFPRPVQVGPADTATTSRAQWPRRCASVHALPLYSKPCHYMPSRHIPTATKPFRRPPPRPISHKIHSKTKERRITVVKTWQLIANGGGKTHPQRMKTPPFWALVQWTTAKEKLPPPPAPPYRMPLPPFARHGSRARIRDPEN